MRPLSLSVWWEATIGDSGDPSQLVCCWKLKGIYRPPSIE